MREIGIDFGTSTLEVATVANRVSSVVAIRGQREVPTLVVFRESEDGPEAVVGQDAFRLHYQTGNPNIVRSVKRDFGTQEAYSFFGKTFEPRYVAAQILRYLIVGASEALNDKELKIVATHPANWSQDQLNDLQAAYLHAIDSLQPDGFELEVEYIREPVAAALARRLGRHVPIGSYVITLDPGGGTTDFAVLQITTERLVTVKASRGVPRFGGDDCDNAIASWIMDEHLLKMAEVQALYNDLDEPGKADVLTRLVWAARRAKEELTSTGKGSVDFVAPYLLEGDTGPITCHGKLEAKTMDELVNPLVSQCDEAIDLLLVDAGIGLKDLALAVPLGGTSLLAAFQSFISRKLPGVKVLREGNPLTMVAQGAAMRAAGLVELQDIAGHDYYIETQDGQQLIMERGHPIGKPKAIRLSTKASGQQRARIRVFKDFGVSGMARPKVAEFMVPVQARADQHGKLGVTLVHEDKLRIKVRCGTHEQDEEAQDVAEPDAKTRLEFAEWLRSMAQKTEQRERDREHHQGHNQPGNNEVSTAPVKEFQGAQPLVEPAGKEYGHSHKGGKGKDRHRGKKEGKWK